MEAKILGLNVQDPDGERIQHVRQLQEKHNDFKDKYWHGDMIGDIAESAWYSGRKAAVVINAALHGRVSLKPKSGIESIDSEVN